MIIAFGMNDGVSGGFSPAAYKENTLAIIDGVRAGCSDTEIILVSPMLPNAEAANMLVNQYNYVAVLNEIASERGNVAVADVGTLSFRLLQLKSSAICRQIISIIPMILCIASMLRQLLRLSPTYCKDML